MAPLVARAKGCFTWPATVVETAIVTLSRTGIAGRILGEDKNS